ncbi:hypothetical protein B7P43_G09205 [Cryptotermes secundus]|uniref:Fanconi anemia core complex-associated protein 24 pseudonuclease domain-containing protein n=1 Tax=Cryptotermes secundus TaxID=105785 RepID=A0A2J7QGX9_9NEOP|nr:Fanconi anemia core complex-associated protein 24 isoform X2 [Cryptotermes secundus]PNF27844.1 hypothetical protein B7P43_G09205 [Cryptotermes secundus]
MMSSCVTPITKGLNVPAGCILVNEKWRGSKFEKDLSAIGRGIYCDNLGIIDFYLSQLCPVVYINESELISGVSFERKLKKILETGQHHGVVIADRNNLTIKQFSELQNHCFTSKITLIPVGNVSELPQLLVQMAYVECKSPRNPFKQWKKSCDDLAARQLKLFSLIPGVGEKKAQLLLDHFGHPQSLASVPEEMFIAKLTPIIGKSSSQNVYNFFYGKNGLK